MRSVLRREVGDVWRNLTRQGGDLGAGVERGRMEKGWGGWKGMMNVVYGGRDNEMGAGNNQGSARANSALAPSPDIRQHRGTDMLVDHQRRGVTSLA